MSLNLNLGLFLITQNHVFPSSWPVWVESLYFDLHYKYMFYNNCYTCALYIVHHYDISYLTPFVFLFYKKDGLKRSLPPTPPPPSSSVAPVCNAWMVMRFGFLDLFISFRLQTFKQMGREQGVARRDIAAWLRRGKPLQRMTFTTVQKAGRKHLLRQCPRCGVSGIGLPSEAVHRPSEPQGLAPAVSPWDRSCSYCR